MQYINSIFEYHSCQFIVQRFLTKLKYLKAIFEYNGCFCPIMLTLKPLVPVTIKLVHEYFTFSVTINADMYYYVANFAVDLNLMLILLNEQ